VRILNNDVNFVLKDNNLVQIHDLDCCQMLRSLRLRARLIASNKKKCRVHDCCSCEHSSHKDIVTWAIHERDVAHKEELVLAMLALCSVLLIALIGLVALRSRADCAPVEFAVSITQLDGNLTDFLLLMLDGLLRE